MWAGSAGWRPAPRRVGGGGRGPPAAVWPRDRHLLGARGQRSGPRARRPRLEGLGTRCLASGGHPQFSPRALGVRHPRCGSDFLCQGTVGGGGGVGWGTVGAEQSRGVFSPRETNAVFPERLRVSSGRFCTEAQVEEGLPGEAGGAAAQREEGLPGEAADGEGAAAGCSLSSPLLPHRLPGPGLPASGLKISVPQGPRVAARPGPWLVAALPSPVPPQS